VLVRRDGDGVLGPAELLDLARDLCTADGHVGPLAAEALAAASPRVGIARLPAAAPVDAAALLRAVRAGAFARLRLSTHDLSVLRLCRQPEQQVPAPPPVAEADAAAADTSALCLLLTTEVSKVADPGDAATNRKYADMMRSGRGRVSGCRAARASSLAQCSNLSPIS
jgi:hypothetical protein